VGVGSATHLSAERFRVSAGVEGVHVPFKGGVEAMTEVIAGRADLFFVGIALRAISFQSCENHTLPKEISRI
jgi:tripartite-type tricarboxylate transporter receptor subunit TctC